MRKVSTKSWGESPATEHQLEVLEHHGIEIPPKGLTREQAGILIYRKTTPRKPSGATRRGDDWGAGRVVV